jgi:hypothetical protein
MAGTMNEITIGGERIRYSVRYSKRAKFPRIDIALRGIIVVIPRGERISPETLLKENAARVLRQKKKIEKRKKTIPERRFEEGAIFPYLGRSYRVNVGDVEEYAITDGSIVLSAEKVRESSFKEVLQRFYRKEAEKIIREMLAAYAEKLGLRYNTVRFKNQKTRWGSCSHSRNLNFNWRLAMAPREIIEYIIVHELIHLDERNHSARFWQKLSRVLPDYKKRADWLKEHALTLIFSEEDY